MVRPEQNLKIKFCFRGGDLRVAIWREGDKPKFKIGDKLRRKKFEEINNPRLPEIVTVKSIEPQTEYNDSDPFLYGFEEDSEYHGSPVWINIERNCELVKSVKKKTAAKLPTPAELFKQEKLRKGDRLVALEDLYMNPSSGGDRRFTKGKVYPITKIGGNDFALGNDKSITMEHWLGSYDEDGWASKFRLPTNEELRKVDKERQQLTLNDYKAESKSVTSSASRGTKPSKQPLTPEDLKTIDATGKMLELFKKVRKTDGKYPIYGFKSENRELVGPRVVDKTEDIKKTFRSLAKVFYYLVSGESVHTNISFLLDDWPRLEDDNVWYIISMLSGWEKDGKRHGYEKKEEVVKDLKSLKEKIKSKVTTGSQPIKKKQTKKKEIEKKGEKQTSKQQKFKIGDMVRVVDSGEIYSTSDKLAKELGATKYKYGDSFGKEYGGRHNDEERTGIIKNINEKTGIALIEVDNQEWVIGLDGLEHVGRLVSGVIVHCPTKKGWKKVVKAAIEDGCKWSSGGTSTSNYLWDSHKEGSCVSIGVGRIEKEIEFSRKSFYEEAYPQFPIISAQEYLRRIKEKQKQKTKD